MKYTQDQLTELFIQAVKLFNETMGEEYKVGDDGIMLRFFTPDNGIEVYEDFCSTYFPHHLKEDYKRREKFENISAEAFSSEHHDGVMVRADLPFPELELIQIFVHEIAHIYCTHNEIGGEDFYLAFSPERVDPGNLIYKTKNTPKVVGGCTPTCTDIAATMYESVLEAPVHRVSSPAIAEMEKILENTYRNINIGLVNELAILCNRMGISIWDVIDAAKSKPYGFQAFYPGPGLGGHCIPLDPYYLSWKAREYGFHTSMIESSMMINDRMPEYCVERVMHILNRFKKSINGAKVLVLGVAYKQDIDDYRESPAIRVIEKMLEIGADVKFYDPWVKSFKEGSLKMNSEKQLTTELVESTDIVIITAAHTNVDYSFVQKHAKVIFDTKNVMKNITNKDNIELL